MDNVFIGFPHYGTVHTPFMLSVTALIYHDARSRDIIKSCMGYKGLYVAQNRNEIVRSFLERRDCDWLLFLDSDVEFEKDTLYKLLDVADPIEKPIVSGLYFSHVGEPLGRLMPLWYEPKGEDEFSTVAHIPVESLVKLSGCGFGCVLIHRSVFEKFPETDEDYKWFAHDVFKFKGHYKRLGEDFTFCKRARDLGFDIWGHSGVLLNHYKTKCENVDTFIQSQK